MDKQQFIEIIVAMLEELDTKVVVHFYEVISSHIPDERFYEIYTELTEKWERMVWMHKVAKEFADRLKEEEE